MIQPAAKSCSECESGTRCFRTSEQYARLTKKKRGALPWHPTSRFDDTYAAFRYSSSGILVRWYPPQYGHWYDLSTLPVFASRQRDVRGVGFLVRSRYDNMSCESITSERVPE